MKDEVEGGSVCRSPHCIYLYHLFLFPYKLPYLLKHVFWCWYKSAGDGSKPKGSCLFWDAFLAKANVFVDYLRFM